MSAVPDTARSQFKLLEPHSRTLLAAVGTFVATETFRVGASIAGRRLSAVGWNFAEHFLAVVERNVPTAQISAWNLLYTAGDKSLIDGLAGEEKAAVPFLAYIHQLMEMGDKGPCHLDWRSNFAYMRSPIDRRLWAVHWSMNYTNEWNVGAVYVPHEHIDWRAGSRVFGG